MCTITTLNNIMYAYTAKQSKAELNNGHPGGDDIFPGTYPIFSSKLTIIYLWYTYACVCVLKQNECCYFKA